MKQHEAVVKRLTDDVHDRGFAILENAFPADLIDRVAKDAANTAESIEYLEFYGEAVTRASGLLADSSAAVELLAQPPIIGLAESLLLPYCHDVLLSAMTGFQVSRGGADQPLHRDESMLYPYLQRVPYGPEYFVNIMIAATDFTVENGATRIVPGSHRWVAERQPEATDPIEYLVMPKGSMGVWLGSTFHGLGINNTDQPRIGISIGFQLGWLRPHENSILLAPPEIARNFPRKVQEIIGYKRHGDVIGGVRWKSPMDFLR